MLEKRSLELDAPASRPSMYLKENRLPKKLKMPTAAGHTTIAHTPESEGLVGRAGGSGHIQSGSSGGASAGVHGQVCAVSVFIARFMIKSRCTVSTRLELVVQLSPRQLAKRSRRRSWCQEGGAPA